MFPFLRAALLFGFLCQIVGAEPTDLVATKLQPYVADHTIAGAVTLVATPDRILDQGTVGDADIASKKPMRMDTVFLIASMTKPMTATAVMMLVDAGKVKLDDPVEKFLPEFHNTMVKGTNGGPPEPLTHPITVREILSHTAGFAYLGPLETKLADSTSLAERVRSYARTPLETQPGTKFSYSNEGLNTAGRLIEVVSGMPYQTFMQERLFTPLGMKDTTFFPTAKELTRLATLYQASPDDKGLDPTLPALLTWPLDSPGRYPLAAGGLLSTAPDLLKFCRMILAGGQANGRRYLSEASVREMTRVQTTPAQGTAYGLGWMQGPNLFFHDGRFNTRMAIGPHDKRIAIFLVQQAGKWPNGVQDMKAIFTNAAWSVPAP